MMREFAGEVALRAVRGTITAPLTTAATLCYSFQYTPVDSSATWVTLQLRSQSLNSKSSRVNVPNSRVCRRRPVAHKTHAVTLFL